MLGARGAKITPMHRVTAQEYALAKAGPLRITWNELQHLPAKYVLHYLGYMRAESERMQHEQKKQTKGMKNFGRKPRH